MKSDRQSRLLQGPDPDTKQRPTMVALSVPIPEELAHEIRIEAAHSGMDIQALVGEVMHDFLRRYLRDQGSVPDDMRRTSTYDPYFNARVPLEVRDAINVLAVELSRDRGERYTQGMLVRYAYEQGMRARREARMRRSSGF